VLRRFSLTSRLTVFFTSVAAAVVLGLGLLFLIATDRHFQELDRAALRDKKLLIESILAHANSSEDAKWRLDDALSHHHGLYVVVNDAQGNTLFQSAGFHLPERSHSGHPSPDGYSLQAWKSGESEFHAIHFQARTGSAPATDLDIFVAIDIEHHKQFLSDLRRSLAIYASIATLVSGLLGWLAAHQGMAPLRAMKTRAATVTGQRLEGRMPVESVPVEMADLARELNHMLDRLQEDFQRLSDFSSDLAHELRTPISNLLTQTQVTLSAKRDTETYRDTLASNAEELQRLGRMVSDMLFLAKTERGVDLPNKERFSAAAEVQALLEFYEAVAEEKEIRLGAHGDGEIQGDRLMFRRALSNLISNALRHTPERGEVQIQVAREESSVRVTVENTGKEIDPKDIPRLFDRFYRADPARTHPGSDGAGLGLSITKAIVEAHGGNVSASSSQGQTQFSLTFPLKAN
jgi:two-component system heavy metal sensor histidine kinase CusS